MRRWLRVWGPPAAWAAVILLFTSIRLPGAVWRAAPTGTDKIAHVAVYAILGWLTARGVVGTGTDTPRAVLAALSAAALFAALDEAHQAWLPAREPALVDWIADVTGVSLGLGAGIARARRSRGARREDAEDE